MTIWAKIIRVLKEGSSKERSVQQPFWLVTGLVPNITEEQAFEA